MIFSDAFSSHGDQHDLVYWLKGCDKSSKIYLNHGDHDAKNNFKEHLQGLGHKNVEVAKCATYLLALMIFLIN
ncbi:MAG: hypothetical protein K2Q18_12610 [Bdellovibrionales bacterium]|nr:hypothetical protein [Bdellovibrionales bacterium]